MSNLLKKAIWFEENKKHYTDKEKKKLRKTLILMCNDKIKNLTSVFVDSINKIND